MKKIVSLLITMLLALSLLSLVPPSTLADTITVPGDYASIQEAVDNVADGDVITVAPGTYIENIVIDNPNASRSVVADPTLPRLMVVVMIPVRS
jgi:hypothetical protein